MSVRRANKDESKRGSALVEMAMIMPLLMMLCFPTVELGLMLGRYHVILDAARNGARIASLYRPNCNAVSVLQEVQTEVIVLTSFLGMNLDPTNIGVENACVDGLNVRVTVVYEHEFAVINELLRRNTKFPFFAAVSMLNES